jgi:hypothetical protein
MAPGGGWRPVKILPSLADVGPVVPTPAHGSGWRPVKNLPSFNRSF